MLLQPERLRGVNSSCGSPECNQNAARMQPERIVLLICFMICRLTSSKVLLIVLRVAEFASDNGTCQDVSWDPAVLCQQCAGQARCAYDADAFLPTATVSGAASEMLILPSEAFRKQVGIREADAQ